MHERLAELNARRDQAARLEQERADLEIEINAFRQTYLARVGPAQAELDALELHIAEYRVRNDLVRLRGRGLTPAQLEADVDWELRGRRAQFEGYQESVRQAAPAPDADLEPTVRSDLRALYRDLAKRAHPDLALDEADRAERGSWMADINAAYARADVEALQALAQRAAAPGAVDATWDAKRLRTEIERLDTVIAALRADIAELNRSDWLAMKLDAALARWRGIDWFEHARRATQRRAAERRVELDTLIAEFRDRVREAGLA